MLAVGYGYGNDEGLEVHPTPVGSTTAPGDSDRETDTPVPGALSEGPNTFTPSANAAYPAKYTSTVASGATDSANAAIAPDIAAPVALSRVVTA